MTTEEKVRNAVKVGTKKSILMTPDPYHIPRYGGFCPQFKYRIGHTFGQMTSQLLTDGVASSGKLVLASIDPKQNTERAESEVRSSIIRGRTASFGDQKLVERMVPGYTGFIPKSQHYFGKRYAKSCKHAIAGFEQDQQRHTTKIADLSKPAAPTEGKVNPPLHPIARSAKPYIPKNSPQHTMSPFFMENSNPDKRFVSGYTGFVPRARGLLGAGYPFITYMALNEFTDHVTRHKALSSEPVKIHREAPQIKPIYPVETGLVPQYTGHIPGQKFRYGDTFGNSTRNARAKVHKTRHF